MPIDKWMMCSLLVVFGSAQLGAQGTEPLTLEYMLYRDSPEARALRPPDMPFPAHQIVGNIYFVGESRHASFLISSPDPKYLFRG